MGIIMSRFKPPPDPPRWPHLSQEALFLPLFFTISSVRLSILWLIDSFFSLPPSFTSTRAGTRLGIQINSTIFVIYIRTEQTPKQKKLQETP